MLPYLEQAPPYASINFSWGVDPYGDPCYYINSTVANTRLGAMLCPSDPKGGKPRQNSYFSSVGTTTDFMTVNCWGGINPGCKPTGSAGIFTYFMSYGLSDIPEGTSNTVAFTESLAGKINAGNGYRGNSTRGIPDSGIAIYDATTQPALILSTLGTCADYFKQGNNISTDKGLMWAFGARAYSLLQTIQTPNDKSYAFGSCQIGCDTCGLDQSWTVAAQSAHAGGVNVLFADGSVKFVKDSIGRRTCYAVGTRDNGEVVSADSY